MVASVLDRLEMPLFRPIWPISSSWFQTIAPNFLPDIDLDPNHWHQVALGDGDKIVLGVNQPATPPKRVFVIVHGLTGDYRSSYNVRMVKRLIPKGVVVVRVNLRGAGPGFGLAQKSYTAGQSQDLRQVLRFVSKQYPKLPCTVMGVSLGANIVLKMMGESRLPSSVDSFVAVSPPFDLAETSERLARECPFFDQYFSKRLIKTAHKLHQYNPDLGQVQFPEKCTVYDFDDVYTAPRHGYKSATHYYDQCSSSRFIPEIHKKGLVLLSKDDPIINYRSFPKFDKEKVDFVCSPKGGHVGFFGHRRAGSLFWMDHLIEKWVEKRLKL